MDTSEGFHEATPEQAALIRLFRDGPQPIALVGAGASLDSGYPDWPALLRQFDEEIDSRPPKWRETLRTIRDPLWQAEEYREALTPSRFEDLIARTFGPREVKEPHLTIAKLPFRHFLTTNYDPSIEEALKRRGVQRPRWFCWDETRALTDFLRNLSSTDGEPSVAYIHGRYHRPADIVLTETSYVRRYVQSEDARRKLLAVFFTRPIVFIGFSMDDPDLAQLMREVATRLGEGASHFAVMGFRTDEDREAIRRRMNGKYGLKVIFYQIHGSDHSGLTRLLASLAPGFGTAAEVVEASPAPPADDEIKELPPPVDPTDPEKGRWGGQPARDHYELRLAGYEAESRSVVQLKLEVASTLADAPLTEPVIFHLHPTFSPSVVSVTPRSGVAELALPAYGAFTVGVEVPESKTKLELDLAGVAELPDWFRAR